jgi:hypothetical protein
VAGQLDAKRLAALITEAAQRPLVANYTQELRARSERMFVEQFHRSLLKNGRADAILDSLHPSFDTAAEAIAAARDVIPTEAPGRKIFAHCTTGRAGRLAGLGRTPERDRPHRPHRRPIRPAQRNFPLIEEYTLGDGFRLEDRAIWCADGLDLESDSRAFRQFDRGHRTSPWFRIPLRLNTVAEARERYRRWAEVRWDAPTRTGWSNTRNRTAVWASSRSKIQMPRRN